MTELIVKAWGWLVKTGRGFYPFIICVFGALFIAADVGWFGLFIGGISFAWALDLASEQAAAKAKMEAVASFVVPMFSGNDTTITVDINHIDHSPANKDRAGQCQ